MRRLYDLLVPRSALRWGHLTKLPRPRRGHVIRSNVVRAGGAGLWSQLGPDLDPAQCPICFQKTDTTAITDNVIDGDLSEGVLRLGVGTHMHGLTISGDPDIRRMVMARIPALQPYRGFLR